MKNKGFTLIELIAVIIILGLVIGIAVTSISGINETVRKKQHENLIKEIEEAASKYAFDTGKTLIFVNELVTEGYYDVNDESGEIIDSEKDEKLNCYIVEMTKKGNYYTAEFKNMKYETASGSCDTDKLNAENANIDIKLNGGTVSSNWYRLNSFTLNASSSSVNIDCNSNSCIWTSNSGFRQTGTNQITINNINVLNTKYTFQYTVINDNKVDRYTKSVEVKIDNENPIIYTNNIYVYEDGDVKKVDIEASDGAGSGIAGYYFAKDTGQSCGTYTNNKTFNINSPGDYLICVKDNVGRVKSTRITLTFVLPYTLTNLVTNGSFENTGWDNCIYYNVDKKFDNYSCKMTASSSVVEFVSNSSVSMYLNSTHTYYALVYSKSTISSEIQMYWPIDEPGIIFTPYASTTWTKSSAIFTRNSFSNGNYLYRVDFNNNYRSGMIYYDGLTVVDLTATFGAGKEPSKEWCDKNIDYFDGTTIVYK